MEIRRRLSFSRIAAAFAVFAALLWAAAGPLNSARAQNVRPDAFSVSGINVDVTASDSNAARDRAVSQAQRKAWDELFKQLLPPGGKPPAASDADLSRAVQSFSVDDERLSPGRYAAVMTVRFTAESIRKALADAGATAVVEPASRPVVLLPLTLRPDGTPVLWDDRTPWRSAWEAREAKRGALVPLTVPDGELSDVGAISAQEAQAGDAKALSKIAGLHGAGGVAVAKTTLTADGAPPSREMRVDVSLTTLDGVNAAKSVNVRADADDRPADLLARAVTFAAAAVDELWRQERTVPAGPQQTITAQVPLSGINDWIAARQKLAQLGAGTRVDLLSLTRAAATVSIGYGGVVDELRNRMNTQGLTLRQDANGWTVALPQPALTPPPVVQTTPVDQPPARP